MNSRTIDLKKYYLEVAVVAARFLSSDLEELDEGVGSWFNELARFKVVF